jgi:SAM-dependent methyltransferase
MTETADQLFGGSIPQMYERYLVPLMFEPYAVDIAARTATMSPQRVLEIAAGTGVVTRRLAQILPSDTEIVATDFNQSMLDQARALGTARPVEFRIADAMQLPFDDRSFDAVVIQFGVMFFADKAKAFGEVARVLRPGGWLLFNVWDAIEHNEFADTVTRGLEPLFPRGPPPFMARTPHGYYDTAQIVNDVTAGGFNHAPAIVTITARSKAKSARAAAIAYCQGTPLRNEIQARAESTLDEATDVATKAIEKRFGTGLIDGKIQAHVIVVER